MPITQTLARRGATLIELVMGITLASIVVFLATSHITRHQRAYSAAGGELDLRMRLRDASDIVAADLRGSAPSGDTVLVASDTAVEFYSVIGVSVVCTASGNRITLPPDTLLTGRTLSSWVAMPDTGDNVVIFTDSSGASASSWQRHRITAFATTPAALGCPFVAGLLSPADLAGSGRAYVATLLDPVSPDTHRGSPLRLIRRVRYSVYRGGDGKWYLGYRRCSSSSCAGIQPVSGPYETRTGTPLLFRYFSRSGAPVVGVGSSTDIGRVEIVTRGNSISSNQLPGMSARPGGDSTVVTVALRNRH